MNSDFIYVKSLFKSGAPSAASLVPARFLQGASGEYVTNPDVANASKTEYFLSNVKGESFFDSLDLLIFPANFDLKTAIAEGSTIKTLVNITTAASSVSNALSSASATALLGKIAFDFAPGHPQDLQTNYNGIQGPHVDAFRNAASWYFGFVLGYAGFPQNIGEAGAGMVALFEYYGRSNKSIATDGVYKGPKVNELCIQAGYKEGVLESTGSVSALFAPQQTAPVTIDLFGTFLASLDKEISNGLSNVLSIGENQADGSSIVSTYITQTVSAFDPLGDNSSNQSIFYHYSGGNETGALEEIDLEDITRSDVLDFTGRIVTDTLYDQPNLQGSATLLSVTYTVHAGDTFASIAAALGLDPNDGAALAAMNGQLDASTIINQPQIYIPASVGIAQALNFDNDATVSGSGTSSQLTSEMWSFATGGILTLSGGTADGGSFTPLTIEGTQDPANKIYVLNAAGALIDIVPFGTTAGQTGDVVSILETVTDHAAYKSNGALIPASVVVHYTVAQDGFYNSSHPVGTSNSFTSSDTSVGLPFASEDGGITTTATADIKSGGQIVNGAIAAATFNASDAVPDASWSIGVDFLGDAVLTGLDGSGYDGTATLTQGEGGTITINSVDLGQSAYGLFVIPDSGRSGTFGDDYPAFVQNIIAEGTGTSNLNLATYGNSYWHINGVNDTFTLNNFRPTEFYLAGPSTSYQLAWDGNGKLAVTGGTTGTTTFHIATGTGDINFSDGVTVGLGGNAASGTEDDRIYGGTVVNNASSFALDGGDQTVFGVANAGSVDFEAGSDDPADWSITEAAVPGQPIAVTFDGNDAGYDGVATLSGVQQVTLNDITYQLDAIAAAGTKTIPSGSSNIVVDAGNALLTFNDSASQKISDWFVGGQNDKATLLAGTTEILLTGAESDYTLAYGAKNQLVITGGATGTTTIALDGGNGEIEFGDGSAVGLGDMEDEIEYAGSGGGPLTVDDYGIAYGGSDTQVFVLGQDGTIVDGTGTNFIEGLGNQSDYTASYDANGDLTLVDSVDDRNGTTTVDVGAGPGYVFFADFGSIVVPGVACFCLGTMILLDSGEVPVEQLQIGDRVVTASGKVRPIRWIGERAYQRRFAERNPALWSVRFQAGCLGNGLPHRDLFVSGEHAMSLDGLLIPARHLINGTTITRQRPRADLRYVHIELETHDVIFAEGASAETFLDDDSRGIFHNAAEFYTLYPEPRTDRAFYAPRVEKGYELETVRRRLNTYAIELQRVA